MIRSKIVAALLIPFLVFGPGFPALPFNVNAQQLNLPAPGRMVGLSASHVPVLIKGLKVFPNNPFRFDFIIDTGNISVNDESLKLETDRLVKYFLTTLTVPSTDLWVNLSPYEKDRIIPEALAVTEMGRDLLSQDYMLKQISASLSFPEGDLGRAFWDQIRVKAQKLYGTTNIPINTFNKVWIVPDKAVVYQNGDSVFLGESHLKVMLESDYLSLQNTLAQNTHVKGPSLSENEMKVLNAVSSPLVRELILPELEREVNTGENFAKVRQIYSSMILAAWYKKNLRESILARAYVNQSKVKGIDLDDKTIKEKIYHQYLEAFKRGVYNIIREDKDPMTNEMIPRKYFAGGFAGEEIEGKIETMKVSADEWAAQVNQGITGSSRTAEIFLRKYHEGYHEQGDFGNVVVAIAAELAGLLARQGKILPQEGNRFELLQAVRELGGEVKLENGGTLRIQSIGLHDVLVMIDPRFQKDHIGRGSFQLAVYAADETKALHELEEMRYWLTYAQENEIATADQISDGQMGQLLREWGNGLDLEPEQKTGNVLRDRQNALIRAYNRAHRNGLRAEGEDEQAMHYQDIPLLGADAAPLNDFDFAVASTGHQRELDLQERGEKLAELLDRFSRAAVEQSHQNLEEIIGTNLQKSEIIHQYRESGLTLASFYMQEWTRINSQLDVLEARNRALSDNPDDVTSEIQSQQFKELEKIRGQLRELFEAARMLFVRFEEFLGPELAGTIPTAWGADFTSQFLKIFYLQQLTNYTVSQLQRIQSMELADQESRGGETNKLINLYKSDFSVQGPRYYETFGVKSDWYHSYAQLSPSAFRQGWLAISQHPMIAGILGKDGIASFERQAAQILSEDIISRLDDRLVFGTMDSSREFAEGVKMLYWLAERNSFVRRRFLPLLIMVVWAEKIRSVQNDFHPDTFKMPLLDLMSSFTEADVSAIRPYFPDWEQLMAIVNIKDARNERAVFDIFQFVVSDPSPDAKNGDVILNPFLTQLANASIVMLKGTGQEKNMANLYITILLAFDNDYPGWSPAFEHLFWELLPHISEEEKVAIRRKLGPRFFNHLLISKDITATTLEGAVLLFDKTPDEIQKTIDFLLKTGPSIDRPYSSIHVPDSMAELEVYFNLANQEGAGDFLARLLQSGYSLRPQYLGILQDIFSEKEAVVQVLDALLSKRPEGHRNMINYHNLFGLAKLKDHQDFLPFLALIKEHGELLPVALGSFWMSEGGKDSARLQRVNEALMVFLLDTDTKLKQQDVSQDDRERLLYLLCQARFGIEELGSFMKNPQFISSLMSALEIISGVAVEQINSVHLKKYFIDNNPIPLRLALFDLREASDTAGVAKKQTSFSSFYQERINRRSTKITLEALLGKTIVEVLPPMGRTLRFRVEGDSRVYHLKFLAEGKNREGLAGEAILLQAVQDGVLEMDSSLRDSFPKVVTDSSGGTVFHFTDIAELLRQSNLPVTESVEGIIYVDVEETFAYITKDSGVHNRQLRKATIIRGLLTALNQFLVMGENGILRDEQMLHRIGIWEWLQFYISTNEGVGSIQAKIIQDWFKYPNISIRGGRDFEHYRFGNSTVKDIEKTGQYFIYYFTVAGASFRHNNLKMSEFRAFVEIVFAQFNTTPYPGFADEIWELVGNVDYFGRNFSGETRTEVSKKQLRRHGFNPHEIFRSLISRQDFELSDHDDTVGYLTEGFDLQDLVNEIYPYEQEGHKKLRAFFRMVQKEPRTRGVLFKPQFIEAIAQASLDYVADSRYHKSLDTQEIISKLTEKPPKALKRKVDAASERSSLGGIDLNPDLLDLQTFGQGVDLNFTSGIENVEDLQIEGLFPVIYQIIPTNLPVFMGRPSSPENEKNNLSFSRP